ncbi:MAG: HAMP domain-containing protein, partial [Deltaproteobacteria bacterium]|nr:HAMP domain-containing protein [Deltaproteobacteria bacterium]
MEPQINSDNVTSPVAPSPRPFARRIFQTFVILTAMGVAGYAVTQFHTIRKFENPIAYAMVGDILYLVEKENNTLLELRGFQSGQPMSATGIYRIEEDDAEYYYMVRKIHPGPEGIIVHSYVYKKGSREFVGYRYRRYLDPNHPPLDIFTIYFKTPLDYPEVNYAYDQAGYHFFVNNINGLHNVWRVPPQGRVVMRDDVVPPEVRSYGDLNDTLSQWGDITIGPEERIFVSSSATGRVIEYAPDGRRVRDIGTVGFAPGELLAPVNIFFVSLDQARPALLTVASTGNRTWTQFDAAGQVVQTISPLAAGYPYPDILVEDIFAPEPAGKRYSFDLVNKSLVIHGDNFTVCDTYRATPWSKLLILMAGALTLLVIGVYAGKLARFWVNLRVPFFVKLLVLFLPVLVFSGWCVGDWVKDIMMADLEAEFLRRSANLARAVVNTLSLADLEGIAAPEDRGKPVYEKVYQTITRLVDTKNVSRTPKWVLHKILDGKFYFGVNIWRGPIFEPVIVPKDRNIFFAVVKEKTCQQGRYADEQGQWFSYLTPILNAHGEVIYVLELYRPSEEFDRADHEANIQVLQVVGATTLFTALLVLVFSYVFTRPLRRLIQGTRIISTGDFDHRIGTLSRDEVGDLAGAFDQMAVDLGRYTQDLARTTAEKERIQSELRLARRIQQDALPTIFPPIPEAGNVEIFARTEPAKEVGGDYYDFFLIDENHIGVVVADVSGKGVPAGLFMMRTRTLLRSVMVNNLSAAEAISKTNDFLSIDNPSAHFV